MAGRIFFFLCLCILFEQSFSQNTNKIVGIKLLEFNGNHSEFFSELNELSINTIFIVSEKTLQDSVFRAKALKHKINIFLTAQIFMNETACKEDSTIYSITNKGTRAIESWAHFVCPSNQEYRTKRIKHFVELVKQYQPYGFSIDFIRYFAFWENIYPETQFSDLQNSCFCDQCLLKFSEYIGKDFPAELKTTQSKADWILKYYSDEFTKFKCVTIESMVSELTTAIKSVKPDIVFNLHTVPWKQNDYHGAVKKITGQDFKILGKYTNMLSPMCYSNLLKHDSKWINEIVDDMYLYSGSKILPSIQINTIQENETEYNDEEFKECLSQALISPSAGVVFFVWDWNSIKHNHKKKQIIKEMLK